MADAFTGAEEADAGGGFGPVVLGGDFVEAEAAEVVGFEDDAVVGGALLEDAFGVDAGGDEVGFGAFPFGEGFGVFFAAEEGAVDV